MADINSIGVLNYGRMYRHNFTNPDNVLDLLGEGQIAYVKDQDTEYDFILTRTLKCWTQIGSFAVETAQREENIMTEKEAGKCLVELFADYERLSSKLGYSTSQKYAEAVSLAIMALSENKR